MLSFQKKSENASKSDLLRSCSTEGVQEDLIFETFASHSLEEWRAREYSIKGGHSVSRGVVGGVRSPGGRVSDGEPWDGGFQEKKGGHWRPVENERWGIPPRKIEGRIQEWP